MALSKITNTGIDNITVDSSGNVGVGTASPVSTLDINGLVSLGGSTSRSINYRSGDNDILYEFDAGDFYRQDIGNSTHSWFTGNSERMLIDASGNIALNGSVRDSSRFTINGNVSNPNLQSWQNTTSGVTHFWFRNPNGVVGSIVTSGSSTSYNTSSDYRLKENVTDITDATTRLKQLNPVRFNFIADADTTVDGFLAHEVQGVVPEAISGIHDEVDDDGNPVYQGIDQSKLTPLLTKALIEAVEKIEQLEARITALEAN
jgi:nitrogen regulatory protein PII-like uncharacterized protein